VTFDEPNVESEGYALFLPADFEVDGRSEQLARAQVPAGQIYILHTWSLQATRLNAAGQAEQLVAGALAGKILWQLAISHREKGVYPTHVEFRPNSNAGVVSGKSVLSSVLAPDGPLAGEGHSQLREYGYFKCGFSPIIIQPGSQIWINVRAIATNVNVGEVINALGCQFYGSWRGYSMNV